MWLVLLGILALLLVPVVLGVLWAMFESVPAFLSAAASFVTSLAHFRLWGVYVIGVVLCLLYIRAKNYRGTRKQGSPLVNGSFWMFVAHCWTFAFIYIKVFAWSFPNVRGFLSFLSQWSTWEPMASLVSALLILAGLAAFSGFLWKIWWKRWFVPVDLKKRGIVQFFGTRLGAIGDKHSFFHRISKKFMPESLGEGLHVVFHPFFRVSEEADQTSLEKEKHEFTVQEMTPDDVENMIKFLLSGLSVDPANVNKFVEYVDGFVGIKELLETIVADAIIPWILDGEDKTTPQTWRELKQRKNELRKIAIRALLENSGNEFAGGDLDAKIHEAMTGKEFAMPRFGIIIGQLLVKDIKADPEIERAAKAGAVEKLERIGEMQGTKTIGDRARTALEAVFSHLTDAERKTDLEYRRAYIKMVHRLSVEKLVHEGHGRAVIAEGPGAGALAGFDAIATALGGPDRRYDVSPAYNQPPSQPSSGLGTDQSQRRGKKRRRT